MKQFTLLLAGLLCTSVIYGQWGKKITGNGNVITKERQVGSYDKVSLSGWFDVKLVDGKEGELELRGEENLLEYLVTEVDNGTLKIRSKKGYSLRPSRWKDGIQITVPVQSISGVSLSGSGDISSTTLIRSSEFKASLSGSGDVEVEVEADEVEAGLTGSGDLSLSGEASSLEIRVSGSGDVEAANLKCREVAVTVSGSADVSVYATEYLKARISGSGDIDYRGNPAKTDTRVSGSGDISKY